MQLSDIPHNPTRSTLRSFGLLCLLFFGGMAILRMLKHGPSPALWMLLALGCAAALVGLLQPSLLRWVFVGWMYLAFPIGWLVSRIALGILFFCVFAPLGIVFRIMERDRLRLRPSEQGSCWTVKPVPTDPAAYFRQF
jgi:hypothetical protein